MSPAVQTVVLERSTEANPAAEAARSSDGESGPLVHVRDLALDPAGGRVWKKGREIHLTRREFQVLLTLARGKGALVTKEQLLREVWGFHSSISTRRIDYHVRALRRKLEDDPGRPQYIETRLRMGWRFNAEAVQPPQEPSRNGHGLHL